MIKKILLAGHDFKFINSLINKLLERHNIELSIDKWQDHCVHDLETSRYLVKEADIIICEWCLGNLEWYTKHKLPHQRLIARLHLQELDLPYIKRSLVDLIDNIVFVAPHIQNEFLEKFDFSPEKTCVISNYLDPIKFLKVNIGLGEKNPNPSLGLLGYCPSRKRIDRSIDLLESLLKDGHNFSLRIKGFRPDQLTWITHDRDELEFYESMQERISNNINLRDHIFFDNFSTDVNEWFAKIDYILSPSDFESFHMAIGEGMLSGCMPIIWDWNGSSEIWPNQFIVKSTQEAKDLILKTRDDNSAPPDFRGMALKKHNPFKTLDRWSKLIFDHN